MRFEVFCLFALTVFITYATSEVSKNTQHERFLISASSISFSTFTLIKSTTVLTSTITRTTTCTTSTSLLSTCTTGRRRRGLSYDESEVLGRHRRAGLFYSEDEAENKEGTAFLPSVKTNDPVDEVQAKSVSEDLIIPLEIQPGFSLPEGAETNRFLLAFGISTRTSFFFTTSTVSLTAICISTSGFPLCGGVGK